MVRLFDEKLTVAVWKTKPTWFLISAKDRMLHPAMEVSLHLPWLLVRTQYLPFSLQTLHSLLVDLLAGRSLSTPTTGISTGANITFVLGSVDEHFTDMSSQGAISEAYFLSYSGQSRKKKYIFARIVPSWLYRKCCLLI